MADHVTHRMTDLVTNNVINLLRTDHKLLIINCFMLEPEGSRNLCCHGQN